MMRRMLFAVAAAAMVLAPPAAAKTVTVQITSAGFVPSAVTVDVGDTVTWTNADTTRHQVVATSGAFSSPVLQPGQSYSYTFRTAGRYTYRDAFAKNRRGTVTVNDTVTLRSSSRAVTYGSSVTLSGVVSNQRAGETVVIHSQACGGATLTRLATVTTTTGGAWRYVVKPSANTTYQARWKTTTSAQVNVGVRPRIALRKLSRTRFSVRVSAAQSFAGKIVVLQRFNRSRGVCVGVKRVTLRASTLGVAPTVVSARTFRASVSRGLRLRIRMLRTQTGPCYLEGRSNIVRS